MTYDSGEMDQLTTTIQGLATDLKAFESKGEAAAAATKSTRVKDIVGIAIAVVTALGASGAGIDHLASQRVETLEAKVQVLGEHQVKDERNRVEAMRYVSEMIQAAHPETAGRVTKPDFVKEAEAKAKQTRLKQEVDSLFEGIGTE